MNYIENIDAPQFFSADACKAAGIESATLKNWLLPDRHAILMSEEDRRAAGSGRPHLFTYRRVMQIALTAELVSLGFAPRRAGTMAAGFTDVGEGFSGWVGEVYPVPKLRGPGELFEDGFTFLIASPGEESSHVCQVDLKTPLVKLMWSPGIGTRSTAAMINVNHVDWRVKESLGLPRGWATGRRSA